MLDVIAFAALLISLVAFVVAIADWLQLGREAPWEVSWGDAGVVVLTRKHYRKVWIEGLSNFHAGEVEVRNDAAFPK